MKTFVGCAAVNFRRGRPSGFQPEAIVIHIGEGSLRSIDMQFNDPNAKVSAHYCVSKAGDHPPVCGRKRYRVSRREH